MVKKNAKSEDNIKKLKDKYVQFSIKDTVNKLEHEIKAVTAYIGMA